MAAEGEIEGFHYPRDLLRRFSGEEAAAEAAPEFAGEVELSLGLSLGGGGGGQKGLARSSSISMIPAAGRAAEETQWLARTHSLPVESEEEWRRRKEMQSLKRMEAKRKRSEKRARERKGDSEEEAVAVAVVGPTVKVKQEEVVVCGEAKGEAEVGGGAYRWVGPRKPASQRSIGSQGSSSSGVSDFESKSLHGLETTGLRNCTEVRSSSMLEHAASNGMIPSPIPKKHASPSKGEDEAPKRRKISTVKSNGASEMERSMMDEMPCVSTRGDGPNGKRIEGFLYRYRKGEEVRIVCVCHGSFLTPAEFVKHAGGGDVDHPLRHIVVNPNPFAML